MGGKCIIVSAPSGAGKTTIVKYLLSQDLNLAFSISATNRVPREGEKNGVDYHFFDTKTFKEKIKNNEFVEWEEVYPDQFYGTLNSEIARIWQLGNHVIFDVDVVGGLNLKKHFKENALALFIMPPSVDELKNRLQSRASESAEKINLRVSKAEAELAYADQFDKVIINDDLAQAKEATKQMITDFLS